MYITVGNLFRYFYTGIYRFFGKLKWGIALRLKNWANKCQKKSFVTMFFLQWQLHLMWISHTWPKPQSKLKSRSDIKKCKYLVPIIPPKCVSTVIIKNALNDHDTNYPSYFRLAKHIWNLFLHLLQCLNLPVDSCQRSKL